ncbi:MAG TPA: HisA/HisF-related TIM barrel protein [Candidatus Acidoferrales bacterium]|nr:HisA/HisF-related TIM barrel protein [Candidatus Acidoferrales bacterium]
MLIPCIDLQGGEAVQLVHGRRRELAVSDVFGLLKKFGHHEWLHVIDLDAAMRKGHNRRMVSELCARAKREHGMKVRVGGGIRTVRAAEQLIGLGVAQIIIGSAAFRKGRPNLAFLKRLRGRVNKKQVLIALDTAKGKIVIHGWRTSLRISPREVMAALEPFCGGFLCTDVDREGTMSGVNLEWFRDLRAATKLPIVAAGGISSRLEIRALEKLGMDAAVGMALYKNRVR